MTSPIGSTNSEPRIVMSNASTETEKQIDAIEKEALETIEHLPKQKQDQYNLMVRQGVNKIRMHIANLRSHGKTEYEITKVLKILIQDFKTSNESFIQKNQVWNATKEVAINNLKHNTQTINNLNSDFGKIKRFEPFGENDEYEREDYYSITADVSNDKKGYLFKSQIQGIDKTIQNRLNEMELTGYTKEQRQEFRQEMNVKLRDLKQEYVKKTEITNDEIIKVYRSIEDIQDKIRNQ